MITSNLADDLWTHLHQLSVTIGPRPIGSRANHAAEDYIHETLARAGMTTTRQSFPCPLWEHDATMLEAAGERLVARANLFSPACDVAGELVPIATMSDLEHADLTGRIAMLHGLLPGEVVPARNAIYVSPNAKQMVRLLEEKRPSAIIAANTELGSIQSLFQDPELPIPSVAVPPEVALRLLRDRGQQVRVRIHCRHTADTFSNVAARKPGPSERRLVLCAHFDSQWDTPGAWDNGSGVAVLLTLAGVLARKDLACSLEFVAFNAEEVGGIGDTAYHEQVRDGEQILAAINVDGVGHDLSVTTLTMVGEFPEVERRIGKVLDGYPDIVRVDPWWESNHAGFAFRRLPAIALSSKGSAKVLHLPSDTVEWLSVEKLAESVALVESLVDALQDLVPA